METDEHLGWRVRIPTSRIRILALLMACTMVMGCGTSPYSGDITITASDDFKEASGLLPRFLWSIFQAHSQDTLAPAAASKKNATELEYTGMCL